MSMFRKVLLYLISTVNTNKETNRGPSAFKIALKKKIFKEKLKLSILIICLVSG